MKGLWFSMRMIVTLLAGVALAGPAVAGAIVPHRAIYNLELDSKGPKTNLSSVEGRLAFEVAEAGCDGWTVSFRMANRYKPIDGDIRLVDTQSTSFEAKDGSRFDYSEKTFVNDRLESETRAKVSRDGTESAGQGTLTLPSEKEFTLESGVLFPMQHQSRLMALATGGAARDVSEVYDGSEEDKTMRIITFAGKARPSGEAGLAEGNAELDPLRQLSAWPITSSYFETGKGEQDTPDYTVSFDMFENGVASRLRMDYGTFKIKGELSRLELFKPETCE